MAASNDALKTYASHLRSMVDSTNSDFVNWSKSEWPPEGFSDQTNVLGSVLGSDKKKVDKWNSDYNFFRSWVKIRDRFKDLESKAKSPSLLANNQEIFDELRNYNAEVNSIRATLVDRGGKLTLEDMQPPAPGSDQPPPDPRHNLKGISMTQALLIVGAAAAVGGGVGYYVKKNRRQAGAMPSLSYSQTSHALMSHSRNR